MGADLTMLSKPEARHSAFEVSQKAMDGGYFRDAYNSFGLFSVLSASTGTSYSWWQFSREAEENGWLDENHDLKPEGAEVLLERVKEAKKMVKDIKRLSHFDYSAEIESIKPLSVEDDQFSRQWLELLIQFLNEAVKTKSKIGWSV